MMRAEDLEGDILMTAARTVLRANSNQTEVHGQTYPQHNLHVKDLHPDAHSDQTQTRLMGKDGVTRQQALADSIVIPSVETATYSLLE